MAQLTTYVTRSWLVGFELLSQDGEMRLVGGKTQHYEISWREGGGREGGRGEEGGRREGGRREGGERREGRGGREGGRGEGGRKEGGRRGKEEEEAGGEGEEGGKEECYNHTHTHMHELTISSIQAMMCVGIMVWLASLFPDVVHHLVFSLTRHISIREDHLIHNDVTMMSFT